MSVAALSTASPILGTAATTASAASAGQAAVNDTQPFARLIEQPAADDKAPGKAAKSSPDAENGEIVDDGKISDPLAALNTDTAGDDKKDDGGSDLLADIEAMVAAAGQLVVVPQSGPAAPVVTNAKAAGTKSDIVGLATTPSSMASAAAPAPDRPAAASGAAIPSLPVAPEIADTEADSVAEQAPKANPVARGTSIASIVAALKSSVAKAEAPDMATMTPAPTASLEPESTVARVESAPMQRAKEPVVGADVSAPTLLGQPAAKIITDDATTAAADTTKPGTLGTGRETAAETKPAKTTSSTEVPAAVIPVEANITATPKPTSAAPVQPKGNQPEINRPEVGQAKVGRSDGPAAQPEKLLPIAPRDGAAADRAATIETKPRRDGRIAEATGDADAAPAVTAFAPVATPVPVTAPLAERIPLDGSAPSATATLADQTVDRQIDLARDTQWLDRLARDISQAAAQQGELKFHLNPEHLGSLHIELSNSAAGTSIRMTTDNDQARSIIADAQPQLLAEVRAQGLRIAESQVDLNNQQRSSGGNGQMAGGQTTGDQQKRSSEDHKPFSTTPTNQRDVPGDSGARDDGELYA